MAFGPMVHHRCYRCDRPVRFWMRRLQVEQTHMVHRACWERDEFFRRNVFEPLARLWTDKPRSVRAMDYEVVTIENESRGIIVVWNFGWASHRYGEMRINTDLLNQSAGHFIHRLGEVSIAPSST
jgi:hypothetical protein